MTPGGRGRRPEEIEGRGWRVYYADGSTMDSSEARWAELPQEGVVGVVQFLTPPYRRLRDGGDWYWRDAETGRVQKSGTRWGGQVPVPGEAQGHVLQGAGLPDEEYEKITVRMNADDDWPESGEG